MSDCIDKLRDLRKELELAKEIVAGIERKIKTYEDILYPEQRR